VDRLPVTVSLRQVAPRDARAITIDHGIDEQTVVGCSAADMSLPTGKEIFDLVSLVVAQSIAMHVSASPQPTPHESETK
jgi:hypothetical protein